MIVSYHLKIFISDSSEFDLAEENSEAKEVASILKWLN